MRTEQLTRSRRRSQERPCARIAGPAVQSAASRVAGRGWLRPAATVYVDRPPHDPNGVALSASSPDVNGSAVEQRVLVPLGWWLLSRSRTGTDRQAHWP